MVFWWSRKKYYFIHLQLVPLSFIQLDLEEMDLLKEAAAQIKEDQDELKRNHELERQGRSSEIHHRRKHKHAGAGRSVAKLGLAQMDPLELKTLRRQRNLGLLTSKLEIDQ